MKKTLCIILSATLLAMSAVPALAAENNNAPVLKEGTYAPNQVVVLFRDSAIDIGTSPKKGELEAVGASFGDMMNASYSEKEALSAADEEIGILAKSLGSDFLLEDTLVFAEEGSKKSKAGESVGASSGTPSGELTVALVSSDKYDTAALIEKLGKNNNVAAVEPNYYINTNSFDDYSLNDEYSSYLYHVNSPAAKNTGGDSVDNRGFDPETALSVNASSGWSKLSGDEEEAVVAVIDSGVLYTHEDLADMMWTNPGDIGLKGTYGYNFAYKNDDPIDDVGHGTHCAGVIAAQANNGKGVAGIASQANIKIMALKTLAGGGFGSSTAYATYGAFNYIHKAVLGGVNVVAVNNSWGGYSQSTIYDDLIDLLGEDGVVPVIAAGNDGINNDNNVLAPSNSESDYAVTVGAANINGKAALFSDYGKASVDVFGPGVNILSSVSYKTYFPSIYNAEQLNATTEYYGEFNASTKVVDGTITPSTGAKAGADIKPFGSLQFVKQSAYESYDDGGEGYDDGYTDETIDEGDDGYDDEGGEEQPVVYPEAELKLSVEQGEHFSSDNPYRLKITLKNANPGENYYIYFPYEKNPLTTGDDNTSFSFYVEPIARECSAEVVIYGGEVCEDENGRLTLTDAYGYGNGISLATTDKMSEGVQRHVVNNYQKGLKYLLSADEADGKNVGLGICIKGEWTNEVTNDFSLYLDSIALSKPDFEADPNTSYDVMSGTSMSTPAVTGACALIASLNPRMQGESGGEYAKRIRATLFSCVRQTEELKDKCFTGGYVDLSLLNANTPAVTDAVCNADNETITIFGQNLTEGSTITYRSLAEDGAQETALPDNMSVTYSSDGKLLVINNAKSLFSTYTAFTVTNPEGARGTGKSFLVKGQNKLDTVSSYKKAQSQKLETPYLATDAGGNKLYGYYNSTATVSYFDGKQFNNLNSSDLKADMLEYLVALGIDRYDVYNGYTVTLTPPSVPVIENGVIYTFAFANPPDEPHDDSEDDYGDNNDDDGYDDTGDGDDTFDEPEEPAADIDPILLGTTGYYICTFDLNEENPHWSFQYLEELPSIFLMSNFQTASCYCNGKIYAVPAIESDSVWAKENPLSMYSISLETGKWTEEPDVPVVAGGFDFVSYDGKLYVMFGFDPDEDLSVEQRTLKSVYCFDGENWEQKSDIKLVGRVTNYHSKLSRYDAVTKVKDGFVFVNTSTDGGGNVFFYNPDTDEVKPLYYTLNDSLSDSYGINHSCAVTNDGIYYINQTEDDYNRGWKLSLLPKSSDVYKSPYENGIICGDSNGDGRITINDATEIQRHIAEISLLSGNNLLAADVNNDGIITIDDATVLQRYLAKYAVDYPIGQMID